MSVASKNEEIRDSKVSAPLPEPLFRLVGQAVEESATDVHLDAWGDHAVVRFRVDGSVDQREPVT